MQPEREAGVLSGERPDALEAPDGEDLHHSREQLRMLLFGFGTGMLIAFVFLIYVIMAFAHWFP